MAASTPYRRTGCIVISVTRSGRMHESSIAMPSRTLRYSGSERPAWRMNHTGVCGTGSRRHALRKAESWGAVGWPVGRSLALTLEVSHEPGTRLPTGCGHRHGARDHPAGCPPCTRAPFPLTFPAWLRLRDIYRTALTVRTARRAH